MTKEQLRAFSKLQRELTSFEKRLEEARQRKDTLKAKPMSGMPSSHSVASQVEMAVVLFVEMEESYYKRLKEFTTALKAVNAAINAVENPDERTLLQYRYLDDMPWSGIQEKMHVSHATLHRIHAKALMDIKEK